MTIKNNGIIIDKSNDNKKIKEWIIKIMRLLLTYVVIKTIITEIMKTLIINIMIITVIIIINNNNS